MASKGPPPGYSAASVLDDMRRLNLVAQGESYAGAAANQPQQYQQQQQQPAHQATQGLPNYELQQSQYRAERIQQDRNDFDFEADQLASALEFALSEGAADGHDQFNTQFQPAPPQSYHQQHHHQQQQQQPYYGAQPPPQQQQQYPPMQAPPQHHFQQQPPPPYPPQYGSPMQQPHQPPPPQHYGQQQPQHTPPMAPQHFSPQQYHHTPPPGAWAGHAPPPMHLGASAAYGAPPRGAGRGGLDEQGRPRQTRRMKAGELQRLIEQQQKAVYTDDPLSDDYYCLKMSEKHLQNQAALQRMAQQRSRPTDLLAEMGALLADDWSAAAAARRGPLSQDHISGLAGDQLPIKGQTVQAKIAKKRQAWHSEHKVLGRSVKSDLKKPRELIAQHGGSIGGTAQTFQSQLWMLRGILGKIAEKLIDIDDVHQVMEAKVAAARNFLAGSMAYTEAEKVVTGLQQKQVLLCDQLGQLVGFPSLVDEGTGAYDAEREVELVGGWDALFFLIWTPKGRALILRAIPCLLRPHQRAILKTFCTNCAYFVCRNPDGQDEDPVDDEEAKLDLLAATTFGEEFRQVRDMGFITDCLRLTHGVFEQNPAVLSVFVHIPAGQEVIRTLLTHGKQLSGDSSVTEDAKRRWNSESDNFYSMMKVAVSNLEREATA